MIRKAIKIDEDKCIGCGLCVNACKQSAIQLIDGKAKVIGDDYCDGLGNCLPVCPVNAISFEERDTKAFDLEASKERLEKKEQKANNSPMTPCSMSRKIERADITENKADNVIKESCLSSWPVQIKLVSEKASFFNDANLLIAADCTAFAYANFHNEFMKNRVTVIGCPKLDDVDYTEKLTEIISNNNIKSVTIVKMEVPCCNGILMATKNALSNCGKLVPWQIVTISTDGRILEN